MIWSTFIDLIVNPKNVCKTSYTQNRFLVGRAVGESGRYHRGTTNKIARVRTFPAAAITNARETHLIIIFAAQLDRRQ